MTADANASDEKQQTSSSDLLENLHLSEEEWVVIRNLLKRGAYHLIDEKPMLFILRPEILVSLVSVLAKFSVHIDGEVNSLGDRKGSESSSSTDDVGRAE